MSVAMILTALLIVFLIVWMSLTFTNQFCKGTIGFGLCYNTSCPVCAMTPSPSPSNS